MSQAILEDIISNGRGHLVLPWQQASSGCGSYDGRKVTCLATNQTLQEVLWK